VPHLTRTSTDEADTKAGARSIRLTPSLDGQSIPGGPVRGLASSPERGSCLAALVRVKRGSPAGPNSTGHHRGAPRMTTHCVSSFCVVLGCHLVPTCRGSVTVGHVGGATARVVGSRRASCVGCAGRPASCGGIRGTADRDLRWVSSISPAVPVRTGFPVVGSSFRS
jgi:hypothetical protein